MPSFSTTRRVAFTPRQMFDLVADVERYPEFLPLCERLIVKKRGREGDKDMLLAEMTVGYRAIRETFVSRVVLDQAKLQVDAGSPPGSTVTGPFRQLQNRWNFAHAPEGCDVHFSISYEFRSLMLQMLVGSLFDRVFRRYTLAFEDRARTVYGPSGASLVPGAKPGQGR
ncbi:MAG: type II toxin-antitoxin system RatA family toxin [Hyphomicrobiaceae bacterium]|nr:type II toxin-antitoxin system RatA family toxin [Hyphomicrobiaceae bacterium]